MQLTKVQLQEELLKIHQEKGKTVILVTHDIEEAVYLGDRVVVMAANPGVIKDIINIDIEGRKIEQIQNSYPIKIKFMIISLRIEIRMLLSTTSKMERNNGRKKQKNKNFNWTYSSNSIAFGPFKPKDKK